MTDQEEEEQEQEIMGMKEMDKVKEKNGLDIIEATNSRKDQVCGSLEDREQGNLFLSPQEQSQLRRGEDNDTGGGLEAQEQRQLVLHPQKVKRESSLVDQEHLPDGPGPPRTEWGRGA